jgi:hypothetical protein
VRPPEAGPVTVTSQGTTTSARDFGNTLQSAVKVEFVPPAKLPDGTNATHATSISCRPGDPNTDNDNNGNTYASSDVRISQGKRSPARSPTSTRDAMRR